MNLVISSLAILLGLQFSGFGLSRLVFRFSPEKVVCFSPVFGLSYLMTASWWAYRLGFRLDWVTVSVLLVPALALSAFVLFSEKFGGRKQLACLGRQWAVFGVLWLLALVISALPLLWHQGTLILTFGNNDVAHHSAISRFLMEQGRDHLTGFAAQYPHAFVWYADNTFFGYYSFVANVAALSGQQPHAVVSAVLCCITALNTGPVFLLARRALRMERRWALLWSVLGVANALTLFILYHGFGGQVLGAYFGFSLLCLLVGKQDPDWKSSGALSHAAVIGVTMAGLMLSYPHMLPFVLGSALVWRIVDGLQHRDQRWLSGWIVGCILGAVLCSLAIPHRLWAFYLWISQAVADQSGWPVRFLWPDYLLGLIGSSMDQIHVASPRTGLRIAVLTSLTALLLSPFRTLSKVGRGRLIAAIAAIGAIYACALGFALTDGGEVFGSYKAFKILTYFSPLLALIIASCWLGLWQHGAAGRVWAGLFLAGYLAVWGEGIVTMVRGDGRGNVLDNESRKLVALDQADQFTSLNIVTKDYWASMWLVYFFLDKQIYPAYRSYYPPSGLSGQVSFVSGNSKFVVTKGAASHPSVFGLIFSPTPQFFAGYLGQGWHGPENDHEWMGAQGTDAEIVIFASAEVHGIDAVIHLQPYLPGNAYSAWWNDESVAQDFTSDTFRLKLGAVRPGKNVLLLRSKLPPQAPGGGDPRPICFGLRRLELSITH